MAISDEFEFLDCATLQISYQPTGLVNVSFTVVSTNQVPGINPPRDFTQLTFGGINFAGYVTSLESTVIPASVPAVFEHKFSLIMVGCSPSCPREPTAFNV